MTPKTILFGTDFSLAADAAMTQAVNMALRDSAELVIAHVRADRSLVSDALRDVYDAGALTESDSIQAGLDERLQRTRDAGVTASVTVLDGVPSEALAAHAKAIDADLIAVGSLGKTGIERFLLGSTAESTIRHAECPVLVARADTGAKHGYRSILAACDFSDAADAALAAAVDQVVADGRIEILNVMTPPAAVGTGFATAPVSSELTDRLETAVQKACLERVERHRAARANITYSSSYGPIAKTILDKLDERAFDLVALGSHGRSGFKRLLLGSVAEKVVRHAPCSALVVPAGDAD